jgi:hypothetical protein
MFFKWKATRREGGGGVGVIIYLRKEQELW